MSDYPTELPDDHSECEPPDPISNSEVKVLSADGSVGSPHVRVGHRQALKYTNPKQFFCLGFCALWALELAKVGFWIRSGDVSLLQ